MVALPAQCPNVITKPKGLSGEYQIAAGNAGWPSQFRFAVHRFWSRVPELDVRRHPHPRMSWDVIVHRFPQDIETTEQLPDGFKPPAIGSRAEIAQSIRTIFPDANISNLGWLVVDGQGFSIEVNIGNEEPCDGFMLHVRGGEAALGAVMQIARLFEARALDLSSCEFLDRMADPDSGFRQWRAYRDKSVGDTK